MAVYQVTPDARRHRIQNEIWGHQVRHYENKFNLGVVLPGGTGRVVKRAQVGDILEIYRLRPYEQVLRCWFRSRKAVSGTYVLRILDGEIGVAPDATANPAITRNTEATLTGNLTGPAEIVRGNNTSGILRSDDDVVKDNAVAIVCTAASTANEDSDIEFWLELYQTDLR